MNKEVHNYLLSGDNKNIVEKYFNVHFKDYYFFFLIIGFVLIFLLFDPKLHLGGDNVRYLATAKSIITQFKYLDITAPGDPPFVQHPPGYQLLIAPLIALFPNTIIPIKILSCVFTLLTFLMIPVILRKKSTPFFVLIILFLSVTSYYMLEYSSYELSESAYILFTLLAIFWGEKMLVKLRTSYLYSVIIAFIFVYCFYIRIVGLAMIVAGVVYFLYKKEYKIAIILASVSILLIGIWILRNYRLHLPNPYWREFMAKNPECEDEGTIAMLDLFGRFVLVSDRFLLKHLPSLIFSSETFSSDATFIKTAIAVVTFIIFLVGFVKTFTKRASLTEFYTFFYVCVLLLQCPRNAILRYLVPVYPFIIFYLVYGVQTLVKRMISQYSIVIPLVFAVILLVCNLNYTIPKVSESIKNNIAFIKGNKYAGYPLPWVRFAEAHEWINLNTPERAILCSRKPTLSYYFANRKAIRYRYTYNKEIFYQDLVNNKVDYVIIDRFSWHTSVYLVPVINAYRDNFEIVYISRPPETYVLRLKR